MLQHEGFTRSGSTDRPRARATYPADLAHQAYPTYAGGRGRGVAT
jgi:hypothetical protein